MWYKSPTPTAMNSPIENDTRSRTVWRLAKPRLEDLIQHLWQRGFRVLGPVPRDGGIVFDEVRKVADLPVGLREQQQPGRYRLVAGVAGEVFGVVNGPGSLKPSFFAPEEPLLEVRKQGRGFVVDEVMPPPAPLAFIGVRACDLAALAVQDRIFLHDRVRDAHYAARRGARRADRRQLHARGGDLLLHVDGHRPRGHPRPSTSR